MSIGVLIHNFKKPHFKDMYEEGIEYHVKVNGESSQHSHDLIFERLKDARTYKQIIKLSKPQYAAKIVRREYNGWYIAEKDVR